MALSDSSALSSPPSSDNEEEPPKIIIPPKTLKLKGGKLTAASSSPDASPLSSPEPSPPPREPTPPHEYVLADNPDIAFLVMFRSRFNDVFPKNVPNLGPQDIENGVVGSTPSEQIENFLCALLGLVLNRKKYVERGHHARALEEAISTQKSQWPRSWGGSNPLPGTRTFSDMDPTERLTLLKTLVLWSLSTSELISGILKESFKQNRHDDDLNQPLSVQPWGNDGRKRKYWLIEGQNDTPFRLYRENAPKLVNRTWWSVAENLDELKLVEENLRAENSQAGRRLADRINAAIPRLEETLEKRKRKEYRQARRAAFTRPEPGFSLYEGRTRGRRMKYTFSDDDDTSDANSVRRSTRQSNGSTPAEVGGPTVTSSGRHVRSRFGRSYGDAIQNSSEAENSNQAESPRHASGRPRRSAANGLRRAAGSGSNTDDEMSDGDDEAGVSSGEEWGGNDNDIEGKLDEDEEEEASDNESDDSLMDYTGSLIVTLKYRNNPPVVPKQETDLNGFDNAKAGSLQEVESPSTFAPQTSSVAQSSSSLQPGGSPYIPMLQTSPSTSLPISKQPATSPIRAYGQQGQWSPPKPYVTNLSQQASHSPPRPQEPHIGPSYAAPLVAQPSYPPQPTYMSHPSQMHNPNQTQQTFPQTMSGQHGQGPSQQPPLGPDHTNGYSLPRLPPPPNMPPLTQQQPQVNGNRDHVHPLYAPPPHEQAYPTHQQQHSSHGSRVLPNSYQAPPANWR